VTLPPVPYDATAVRPHWDELPADLRTAVTDRLGAPEHTATTAGGGFTRGFAATLTTSAGHRVFVKAARSDSALSRWYAREAAITAALPDGVPTARPRWTLEAAGWTALCLDALPARVPNLPWSPDELDAVLQAWATAADLLRHPRPRAVAELGLPLLADLARMELSQWSAGTLDHPRRADLAALERRLPGYAVDVGVIHGDLRIDNVLVADAPAPTTPRSTDARSADARSGDAGRAWLCDWAWPARGPAWFDTASLLVTAYASGLDADALFADHPTTADAPSDALDATLAALSGYWLARASGPATDASPHSRGHQRFSGTQALAWLGARQGWG
jgi:hypothetical protein